jgi:hypothetical protein
MFRLYRSSADFVAITFRYHIIENLINSFQSDPINLLSSVDFFIIAISFQYSHSQRLTTVLFNVSSEIFKETKTFIILKSWMLRYIVWDYFVAISSHVVPNLTTITSNIGKKYAEQKETIAICRCGHCRCTI